eukprot:354430-Chlamydomonas_euryale.AAC.3
MRSRSREVQATPGPPAGKRHPHHHTCHFSPTPLSAVSPPHTKAPFPLTRHDHDTRSHLCTGRRPSTWRSRCLPLSTAPPPPASAPHPMEAPWRRTAAALDARRAKSPPTCALTAAREARRDAPTRTRTTQVWEKASSGRR